MEDDWQVSTGKQKRKKHNEHTVQNATPISFTKINENIIYKYKQYNLEVSCELSEYFDKINEMFKTSTQYLDSKKKINHNQHNHNKWQNKKLSDCDDMTKILGNFNKLTNENFDIIIKDLKDLEIVNYDDMKIIVENIFKKCVNDFQFIEIYSKLLKFILMECKWIVYNNSKPISFRKYFIDYMETEFNALICEIHTPTTTSPEQNAINKNIRKNTVVLICNLFNECIIGNQLFRYIFSNLETIYLETLIDDYMNYWIIMYDFAKKHWIGNDIKYINEKDKFIKDNLDKFSTRINIMTDYIHSKQKNNVKSQEKQKSNVFVFNNRKKNDTNHDVITTDVKVAEDAPDALEDNINIEYTNEFVFDIDILTISMKDYETIDDWYLMIASLYPDKHDDFMPIFIEYLVNKMDDLKITFKIMKFLCDDDKYKEYVVKYINRNMTVNIYANNKSYSTNSNKLLNMIK